MNPKDIQIFINNRDRLTPLCELITWLLDTGHRNLIVLDNDSTYPPLLEYYDAIDGMVNVIRLGKNLLSKALWCWTASRRSVCAPFVYTDSDIVPVKECPDNVIEHLLGVAQYLGDPYKVGLGLKIDDIPDHYSQAEKVRAWEGQMWKKEIGQLNGVPIYSAGVDTTFALYTEFRPFSLQAVRVGAPYIARHTPWYVNSAELTEEDIYYEQHAAHGCHNWGVSACYSSRVNEFCASKIIAEMETETKTVAAAATETETHTQTGDATTHNA